MSRKRKSGKKKTAGAVPTGNTSSSTAPLPSTTDEAPIPSSPATAAATVSKQDLPSNGSRISRYVSFGLLLGVIALLGFMFYEVMAQFLIPLFLSALLVVIFRPLHRWIHEKSGGREQLSALLTTAAVLLVVLVPMGALLALAAAEGRHVYDQFNATKIVEGVHQIRTNMKLDMPSKNELRLIEHELTILQQSTTLTEAEHDARRTTLYEIEKAGKKIGNEQGLAWPSKAISEEEPPADASEWFLFSTNLIQARELHYNFPEASNKDELDIDQRNQKLDEYRAKVNGVAEHFAEFRNQLLGGKMKTALVELVNPSDEEAEAYVTKVVNYLRDILLRLTGAGVAYAGGLILGSAIMVIGLYFFLLDGPKMIDSFKGLSPIDDEHEQELVSEFALISRAVVVATLLSAIVQGLLAGIGFYFAGLDSVFLLTVLTAVMAMVPFVGAASVWFPCCLYLYFVDNNLTAAIALGVYGAAVVSMADNVIKPYVLHGQSNIHPLFALLSVLGGVSTLGPIGIVIGPMVVAFLQTLLKILQRELTDLDQLGQSPESS